MLKQQIGCDMSWVKDKIRSRWKYIGRDKVIVRRDFKRNMVIIDFNDCWSLFDYRGKFIDSGIREMI